MGAQPSGPVGDVVAWTVEVRADGILVRGVSLHDLEAETADENGTSVDNAALTSNGGLGVLHVTAFSGLTTATVKGADQDQRNLLRLDH